MSQSEPKKVRLKVSPQVARIVSSGAPRDLQISAARGALPLSGKELLAALFFLCNSPDKQIKHTAITTIKELPLSVLSPVLDDPDLPPQLLELVARARLADHELMAQVIMHPATQDETLLYLARKGEHALLERLAGHQRRLDNNPAIAEEIIANPNAERALKFKLGWVDPEQSAEPEEEDLDAALEDADEDVDVDALLEEAEEEGGSKYQIAMNLRVAEKIKIGLTGDKEWRSLLIKDSNKLVQAAVMKNPRITDGEIIMVAKNKTSSDEMIRLILLNKDWMKLYEIKRALATHPKTPMPKAIRLVSLLNTKDLKDLMRSKSVSTIISTTARKEFERRQKRGG